MAESCARCGAPLECNPGPDCWCAQLPSRPMPEAPAGCLCPACLETLPPATQPGAGWPPPT